MIIKNILKCCCASLLTLTSVSAFAEKQEFSQELKEVKITPNQDSVDIEIVQGWYNERCGLSPTHLELKQAKSYGPGSHPGEIRVQFERNVGTPCLQGFGPEKGFLSLNRGWKLPEIADGTYIEV